jgi:hypothetical protein
MEFLISGAKKTAFLICQARFRGIFSRASSAALERRQKQFRCAFKTFL